MISMGLAGCSRIGAGSALIRRAGAAALSEPAGHALWYRSPPAARPTSWRAPGRQARREMEAAGHRGKRPGLAGTTSVAKARPMAIR